MTLDSQEESQPLATFVGRVVGIRANKARRFTSRRLRTLDHQGQIGCFRTDLQAVRNDDYAWHGLTGLHAFEGEKWSEGLDEVVARAVFGALEAAGCDGGRQVEGRKSTNPQVPTGTTEVVRFQPWVASEKRPEPRPPSRREGGRGERKDGVGPVRPFVPGGTRESFA